MRAELGEDPALQGTRHAHEDQPRQSPWIDDEKEFGRLQGRPDDCQDVDDILTYHGGFDDLDDPDGPDIPMGGANRPVRTIAEERRAREVEMEEDGPDDRARDDEDLANTWGVWPQRIPRDRGATGLLRRTKGTPSGTN